MNDRLAKFLSAENISQAQFADEIGVARASVSHILAGRNKPGFDFIESMGRHYPKLNLEWLIYGRGKMYSDEFRMRENTAFPDEETIMNEEREKKVEKTEPTTSPSPSRCIKKIIVFYDDNSFEEIS